jgi:fumarate reductase subunit D
MENGFIDLGGEDKVWRWHRVSAAILLVLIFVHLALRLPQPAGQASSIWLASQDWTEDVLLVALALVATFHVIIGIRLFRRLCPMLWPRPGQRSLMTWCIAAERYSGFALTAFLGLHFCLLIVAAIVYPELDGMLRQAGGPLVTVAEGLILMLLVMHGVGGVRVLIQETFSTHRLDRPLALLAIISALLTPFAWWLVAR